MKKVFYIFLIVVTALIIFTWQKNQARGPVPSSHRAFDKEEVKSSGGTSHLTSNFNSSALTVKTQNYEQALRMVMESENAKVLDLYGLVIDQHGEPVVGAKIRGAIGYNNGPVSSSGEFRYTETDSEGRFNFLGIHGAGIGIWPTKDGYYYNPKLPSTTRPDDYIADPGSPLNLIMWKLQGAQPMSHVKFEARVPNDGTLVSFDLQTGNINPDGSGELQVSFSRNPRQITPGLLHPYDWQVIIAIANGEIVEEADLYPYKAKENGYQKTFEFAMSSNSVPWLAEFSRSFYIKNAKGQYGHLHIDIPTSSKRSDIGIKVESSVNPSGSRNLEPDLSK